MKNENDVLMTNNDLKDSGYTGFGDRDSKRKIFFTQTLPKIAEKKQNKTFEEITERSDHFQGEGVSTHLI